MAKQRSSSAKRSKPSGKPLTSVSADDIDGILNELGAKYFKAPAGNLWLIMVKDDSRVLHINIGLLGGSGGVLPTLHIMVSSFTDALGEEEFPVAAKALLLRNDSMMLGKYSLRQNNDLVIEHAIPLDNAGISKQQMHRTISALGLEAHRCQFARKNGWNFETASGVVSDGGQNVGG